MTRFSIRRVVSLLLTAALVATGPGLALVEARAHAEHGQQDHSRREHFEALGGQDHSDRCTVGIASPPARPSPVGFSSVRAPKICSVIPAPTRIDLASSNAARFHPSRGPPTIL
jgi:hypothetical protein